MTFHDVFEKLAAIDRAAASLLKETGFYSDEGLGGTPHCVHNTRWMERRIRAD